MPTFHRFAAHGSPYYAPERMEGALAANKHDLQKSLGVNIIMVRINFFLLKVVLSDVSSPKKTIIDVCLYNLSNK